RSQARNRRSAGAAQHRTARQTEGYRAGLGAALSLLRCGRRLGAYDVAVRLAIQAVRKAVVAATRMPVFPLTCCARVAWRPGGFLLVHRPHLRDVLPPRAQA